MQAKHDFYRAYVLHSRPYRETSLIVDFMVAELGRVSAVARGARSRRNAQRSLLQPFSRVLISCIGKHELKTLTGAESDQRYWRLSGKALYSGLYLNELLMRLLSAEEADPVLFDNYEQALSALAAGECVEAVLRRFEKQLLAALGYRLSFPPAEAPGAQHYCYTPAQQWQAVPAASAAAQQPRCFSLEILKAIAVDDYSQLQTRRAAKRLMRLVLQPLLGERPLRSKELFRPNLSSQSEGQTRE